MLLDQLTLEEKRALVRVLGRWADQEWYVGVQEGAYSAPEGRIEDVIRGSSRPFREHLCNLEGTRNEEAALAKAISDMFRGVKIMQRERIGGKFNTFLRAHLTERVFRLYFECAGLKTESLRFDETFPTDDSWNLTSEREQ
ncbi:hypothetical protein [Neotabrizicola sp. VNH66]|uniref:hypothetical protein n=1 Tax=Neotabrizicola sp. VNH66 TaxID=3400918 RepID=UPI003BFDA47A